MSHHRSKIVFFLYLLVINISMSTIRRTFEMLCTSKALSVERQRMLSLKCIHGMWIWSEKRNTIKIPNHHKFMVKICWGNRKLPYNQLKSLDLTSKQSYNVPNSSHHLNKFDSKRANKRNQTEGYIYNIRTYIYITKTTNFVKSHTHTHITHTLSKHSCESDIVCCKLLLAKRIIY